MKKIVLGMYFLAAVYAAQAQITFGPKIGLNVFKEKSEYSGSLNVDSGPATQNKIGFQFGAVCNIQVTKYFAVRPELLFNSIGGVFKYDASAPFQEAKVTETLTYISIPVNFAGTCKLGPGRLNVFAAPQFSIAAGGSYKYESPSTTGHGAIRPGNVPEGGITGSTHYYNPFDLGANYGIGYQIQQLLFTAQYSFSVFNNQPHYKDAVSEEHRSGYTTTSKGFTFALTYFFGKTD